MSTTALDHWENIISAYVNGAPVPAMIDAVRTAAIIWCRDTAMIRSTVAAVDVLPDEKIDIEDSPDNLFPGRILNVWSTTNGLITPVGRPELEVLYPKGWPNETTDLIQDVKYWISQRPGSIRLVPRPTFTLLDDLTVEVAYQPKRNATDVPTFLYELYAQEIGIGACGILHSHSMAPYAEPARSGVMLETFTRAISAHAYRSTSGFGNRTRRVVADMK